MSRNKIIFGALCALWLSDTAAASFLDSDFWCRTYGCAVVHDGQNYDIYDNWQFASNSCCVPYGSPMIDFYVRAGNTNITGTLDRAIGWEPDSDESFALGVSQNGGSASGIFDDGDGYLDAGDTMAAFTLNPSTDIRLTETGRAYSHSFFISSYNTRFSLRARASIANATGDFANTIQLGDIKLTPSFDARGNDQGFDYGRRANTSNIQIVSGVDDLGDLSGIPTQIMNFGRFNGIRSRSADIDEQTIRLDFLYEMPPYDLSMGIGSLNVDVEFEFYRER